MNSVFIHRPVAEALSRKLFKGKAIILYGPRQAGKTTLLRGFLEGRREPVLWLNADEPDIRDQLRRPTSTLLRQIAGPHRIVCLDEAQRIPDIGLTLKLFVDSLPEVQVIATGSSSFELANRTAEPLTGRKYEFRLHPLGFHEMVAHHGLRTEKRLIDHRLVFGGYPEIVLKPGEQEELLPLLADSYLFKDILLMDGLKKPTLLEKLLKALALQIGSEVSLNELGSLVGADRGTVEKYLRLLEQAFIVFQLPAFARNVRNELKKSRKVYFWDNGIRNAVLGQFQPIGLRPDAGALWENFLVSERHKLNHFRHRKPFCGFWRTTQQQEIDYLEEQGMTLSAWEFKWSSRAKTAFPLTFRRAYPNAKTRLVTPENVEEFLLEGLSQ
ncbi:MAG: ATP-binding protein [Candidatus Riflebacteria bacterium]|nr:ATP-binding protein [Candidatus Riflebacteria bacterium]